MERASGTTTIVPQEIGPGDIERGNLVSDSLRYYRSTLFLQLWNDMTEYNNNDYPAESHSTGSQPSSVSFGNPLQRRPSPPQHLSSASSYVNLQYLFGVQNTMMNPQKPNRSRRKSNPGSDQTKHRRTRSGCYTCRSRRVKVCKPYPAVYISLVFLADVWQCDENHPTCESMYRRLTLLLRFDCSDRM